MSQLAHAHTPLSGQLRAHRMLALGALLALIAAVAVVLVLSTGNSASTDRSVANQPSAAVRSDGGPEESSVAAAIAPKPSVAAPDESKIAAAVGSARQSDPAPTPHDESDVAVAISGN
jgi:hypothetical protein